MHDLLITHLPLCHPQGLYAEVFLTYEEFNEMFDGSHYRKVRAELPMTEEAFPEVYEKVSKIGRELQEK